MTDKQTTALAKVVFGEPDSIQVRLNNPEFRQLLTDKYFRGCNDLEVRFGLEVCCHLDLDPIAQEIWFIKIWDSDLRREIVTPFVGIAGLRKAANRTGEYSGPLDPEWCGPDGVWRDVWLEQAPPAAARVRVRRKGFDDPVAGVVTYASAVQTKKGGGPRAKWATAPAEMLAKCAEALALRRAFDKLSSVKVQDVDRYETADEHAFRVREDPSDIIKQLTEAATQSDLDQLAAKASGLPDEHKDAAREAWAEARNRVNDQARNAIKSKAKASAEARSRKAKQPPAEPVAEPEPAGGHDYGPAPMTDAEVAAVEAGDQSGFGFGDEGGAK